jgi:hypothetical protein
LTAPLDEPPRISAMRLALLFFSVTISLMAISASCHSAGVDRSARVAAPRNGPARLTPEADNFSALPDAAQQAA